MKSTEHSDIVSTRKRPLLLIGAQCDRFVEREVAMQEGYQCAEEYGCEFLEASSKRVINIERAFYDIVRKLRLQHPV
jgi:GTPase KRas protein